MISWPPQSMLPWKEAFAIKWAVEEQQYYLTGRAFTLIANPAPLQWMVKNKDKKSKVAWRLSCTIFIPKVSLIACVMNKFKNLASCWWTGTICWSNSIQNNCIYTTLFQSSFTEIWLSVDGSSFLMSKPVLMVAWITSRRPHEDETLRKKHPKGVSGWPWKL